MKPDLYAGFLMGLLYPLAQPWIAKQLGATRILEGWELFFAGLAMLVGLIFWDMGKAFVAGWRESMARPVATNVRCFRCGGTTSIEGATWGHTTASGERCWP